MSTTSKNVEHQRKPSIDLGALQHEHSLSSVALKKAEVALQRAMEHHLACNERKQSASAALRAGSMSELGNS
jgi:hypothetical protein